MKKRFAFLFLFMIFLTGCTADHFNEGARYFAQSGTEFKRSHLPEVTVNGQKVFVLRGEIQPEELSGRIKPALVPKGGVVEIHWKYSPRSAILRIQEWHGGKHSWKKVEGNRFQLPEEEGLYLYNLYVSWGKYDSLTGSYSLYLELH